MKLTPDRPYRLNTRLSQDEYDAVYRYAREHRCPSMDAAIRHMIEKYTISSGGANSVPTPRCPDVIQ
jgi:hypothetical protein